MKRLLDCIRILLATMALITLLAGIAAAQGGINLSWDDCGAAGVSQKTFACNSNILTGAVMYGSAIPGADIPDFVQYDSIMNLQTNQPTLPSWWRYNNGGCRGAAAISVDFDFHLGPFTCSDPWQGMAFGGMTVDAGYEGPDRARIRTVGTYSDVTPRPISGNVEYEFFRITLLGNKTVGTGSCAGCSEGACIVFNEIQLEEPYPYKVTLTLPISRNWIVWQQGTGVGVGCPAATPTHAATWGSVKSLYR